MQSKFIILAICSWGIVLPTVSKILKYGAFDSVPMDGNSSKWANFIKISTKLWRFWTDLPPTEEIQDSYNKLAYFSAVIDTFNSIILNFVEVHCFLSAYAVYHATEKLSKIYCNKFQFNLDIRVHKSL